jgi:hypothetical protein
MTSRRQFLLAAAAAVPGLTGRGGPAPRVEALPTLFHGHPDGQTTLVRFIVTGVDAPAARLRVLGPAGRLLGTAGLVRRSDTLAGQLWIPLSTSATIRSDLETPVTRGVHRTTHRLASTPRWTIRWLTLADPGVLRRRFAAVPPWLLAADVAVLSSAGVRVNPWSAPGPEGRDHLDLLRVAVSGRRLSAATGIPLSERALIPEHERSAPFGRQALAGSGVTGIVEDDADTDPATLGLDAGRARMAPLVEAWLAIRTPDAAPSPTVTLIGTDPDFAIQALRSIEEWNGLYAYPRIVVGR